MEDEIDLIDIMKRLWSKKIWFIGVGIICIILAIVYTKFIITPKYTSTSKFILTNNNLETEADTYLYAKLPDRYYTITNSRTVLEKVIANLKIDDIEDLEEFKEKNIEIIYSSSNFLIQVSVTTDDANLSTQLANEIVKVSMEEIKKIYNDDNVQVLDSAIEDWEPINANVIENIIKFFVIGEIILCSYILVVYVLDNKKQKK